MIELIKKSAGPAEAKTGLMARACASGLVTEMLKRAGAEASRPDKLGADFGLRENVYRLSDAQAQAILDLRLQRLTGLEQEKIVNEYRELLDTIEELREILADPHELLKVIRDE